MALSIEDVEKIADLARLELSEEEKRMYQAQLSTILEYVEQLNQLELEQVPPTAHAVPQQNVMREDIARPSLPLDELLLNAPAHAQHQFLIQTVLDEG